MVMSFLILNCIWVVTIFLLQQNKDKLFIVWPFGPHGPTIIWDPAEGEKPIYPYTKDVYRREGKRSSLQFGGQHGFYSLPHYRF